MNPRSSNSLSEEDFLSLLQVMRARFQKFASRHNGMDWNALQLHLEAIYRGERSGHEKLNALSEMERTGGEPDVVGFDSQLDTYIFMDCSPESPKGRRSLCYDQAARESRKEHKPADSALEMACEMGITLLDESEYYALQQLDTFDTKSSSWILTPNDIRELGGALFCMRRFGRVFTDANGAQSYFGDRGFRGIFRPPYLVQ